MLLTGCLTTRELPDWQGQQITETAVRPSPACQWPDLVQVSVDGLPGAFLDSDALKELSVCRSTADSNHDIAAANAEAIDALIAAYNETQKQGDRYINLAEFQLNEIEADRRDANIEAWTYKGLLALVLIGVAL